MKKVVISRTVVIKDLLIKDLLYIQIITFWETNRILSSSSKTASIMDAKLTLISSSSTLKQSVLGTYFSRWGHTHSSDERCLCLIKCSSEALQYLPFFWSTKTQVVAFCNYSNSCYTYFLLARTFWGISLEFFYQT